MKKTKHGILFYTITYLVVFILIKILLNHFNLEYMQWIKYLSLIIVPIGIIVGTIQLLKKRKVLVIIAIILEILLTFVIGGFLLLYLSVNIEETVYKDGKVMVKETHSFMFSNSIRYYDYKNVFVRGRNKRILESYNNNLNEYIDMIYYDEEGNIIRSNDDTEI